MYFEHISYVKIVKTAFENSNGLIGTGLINTPLSSSINFMKSHQMSLMTAIFVAKIRALCPPPRFNYRFIFK